MSQETMKQLKSYYEQYCNEGFDYQDMETVIALVFEIYEKELLQGNVKEKEGKI